MSPSTKRRRKPTRARELGIDDAAYDELLEAQGGKCAICRNPPKEGGRRFHVDHNHRTGKVRGLLCFRCNRALPTYATSEWLEQARLYVHSDEWGMNVDIPDQWADAR